MLVMVGKMWNMLQYLQATGEYAFKIHFSFGVFLECHSF